MPSDMQKTFYPRPLTSVKFDTAISGRIYVNGELIEGAIGIVDGKIAAIKKRISGARDYGDSIILPGRVDPHVHFRDPGYTQKEDFLTGTLSAAFGGVTCILDMPNTEPFLYRYPALEEKEYIASRKAVVDYGLITGMKNRILDEKALKRSPALKIFMAPTTGGIVNELDDLALQYLLNLMKDYGKPVIFHAEDMKFISNEKTGNLIEHLRNRPNMAEESAVRRLISSGKPLHMAHITSTEAVELLKNRTYGQTSEVTPHHLFLTVDSDFENEAYGRVNPPLRKKRDRDALWDALRDGRIDMISSDHAPHTMEEKEEFETAPSGIPGVETALPLILVAVKKGLLEFKRAVEVLIENPAKRFCPRKGSIEVGKDADLLVIDMKKVRRIDAEYLHSKAGWTPFEGMDAIFPESVYLRGKRIIKNGNFEGEKGLGENLWTKHPAGHNGHSEPEREG